MHRHNESDDVTLFWDIFAHTRDDFAVQTPEGAYNRCFWPLSKDKISRHLRGDLSLGLYLLDPFDTVAYGVIDDDSPLGLERLWAVHEQLALWGHGSVLEGSRRGAHLWCFWDSPADPEDARRVLYGAIRWTRLPNDGATIDPQEVEVYPKQTRRGSGIGSLIRAPLGIHRKSGERYPLYDERGIALQGPPASLRAFARCPRINPAAVVRAFSLGEPGRDRDLGAEREAQREREGVEREGRERDPLFPRGSALYDPYLFVSLGPGPIARWMAGVDARDVLAFFGVRLSPSGHGRCPWPEHHKNSDRHPSFYLGADGRWRCMASGASGDLFSFVQRMRGATARETLDFVRLHFPVPGV